ncbi:PREDICTED: STS14 protein-like [Ipomoea nil]|uniref:STS14 protein-like n=1 Tax=Ipomoea nil TaxID=35883 RepID=UPI000901A4AE|nr:PREDICTED: STS14 protein-like [Ipomoea nil]
MVKILSLSVIIALAICHGCAQGVPAAPPTGAATPAPLPRSAQEYLDVHNQARAEVGVAPLTWSPMLATAASLQVRYQRDKQNCSFADISSGKYGGNQLLAGGMAVTPRMAVEHWVEEKSFYDYANNSCAADHKCGVYTQVVWKKSLELGCSQATCPKGQITLTICFYNPPGNIIGERPY